MTQLLQAFVPPRAFDASRDGSRLAVVQGNALVVCELPACTGPRELQMADGRGLGRIRWTADERSVALLDGASMNLIAHPLDGRRAYPLTQFTSGTITDFAWSPDGTRLAIARAQTTNDIVMFKGVR